MRRRLPTYFLYDYTPVDAVELGLPDADHPMAALLGYAYNMAALLERRAATLPFPLRLELGEEIAGFEVSLVGTVLPVVPRLVLPLERPRYGGAE